MLATLIGTTLFSGAANAEALKPHDLCEKQTFRLQMEVRVASRLTDKANREIKRLRIKRLLPFSN